MREKFLSLCGALLLLTMSSAWALETAGKSCYTDGCRAEDGITAGGNCRGVKCVAGSGGTGGGSCSGESCQAGNGGTAGGNCSGNGCLAGAGGTGGGTCSGEKCVAGNGGTSGGICRGPGCTNGNRGRPVKSPVPAPGMPPGPTSLDDIIKQTRPEPDKRCPYTCQAWNPASNSCVGAPMNGCER